MALPIGYADVRIDGEPWRSHFTSQTLGSAVIQLI